MDNSLAENLETQIVDLYKEKEELESQLGTSDTDKILEEYYSLESELSRLYQFKENFKQIESKQIIIESIRSAYIPKFRLSE
ncbi:hypothetical protein [Leptospira terpstrae]|uniref:Uncharacterized protein n=1 Tax=Leptospira terpstrae serovar Hualin str. LT 11-33 = ATCC 700639 TaxID=1257025 RepID=N1VXL6_9LEPT|nr:hypothetical protein [Leptospira terpstrae]EMY60171.1 hypothetical protein LEP1GSC203_1045 [Leptospira terpstrae serovar Hualin str. LT 11-33 = ATCC 700639]